MATRPPQERPPNPNSTFSLACEQALSTKGLFTGYVFPGPSREGFFSSLHISVLLG